MTVTSRGQEWEKLHSRWIYWTYTFFLSWVAFFYIGIRVRQRKWILWGLIYSIPFIIGMIITDTPAMDGWIGDVTVAFTLIVGVMAIVHARRIRSEYLLRLDALSRSDAQRTATLRSQISTEYGAQEGPLRSQSAAQPFSPATASSLNKEWRPTPPAEASDPPFSASTQAFAIDLNNASERELATLPGVGVILAKRAISLRESRGDFRSVEDFGEALNLKPHIVERIRPLVATSTVQQSQRPGSSGRIVDF